VIARMTDSHSSGAAAFADDGIMIDEATVRMARQILAGETDT